MLLKCFYPELNTEPVEYKKPTLTRHWALCMNRGAKTPVSQAHAYQEDAILKGLNSIIIHPFYSHPFLSFPPCILFPSFPPFLLFPPSAHPFLPSLSFLPLHSFLPSLFFLPLHPFLPSLSFLPLHPFLSSLSFLPLHSFLPSLPLFPPFTLFPPFPPLLPFPHFPAFFSSSSSLPFYPYPPSHSFLRLHSFLPFHLYLPFVFKFYFFPLSPSLFPHFPPFSLLPTLSHSSSLCTLPSSSLPLPFLSKSPLPSRPPNPPSLSHLKSV